MKPHKINQGLFSLYCLLCLLTAYSCNTKAEKIKFADNLSTKHGDFLFKETTFDFGVIKDGDTVSHNFSFTNVGLYPLVIHDISTSCGCTVVEYSNEPIPVNGAGNIKVQFSKRHDPGVHSKAIIIKANTDKTYTVIHIQATVLKKAT